MGESTMPPPMMPPPSMGARPMYVDPRMGPVRPSRIATSSALTSPATPFIVLLAGALMMIGSVTTWLTVSLGGHSLGVAGTDAAAGSGTLSSVNGWFTFTGGVVLLLVGGLMLVSAERSIRQLAAVVSFASLAYAIYDLIHILSDISNYNGFVHQGGLPSGLSINVTVGFGLILVLVAGVAAVVASVMAARSS
jgi:hypothetical protein